MLIKKNLKLRENIRLRNNIKLGVDVIGSDREDQWNFFDWSLLKNDFFHECLFNNSLINLDGSLNLGFFDINENKENGIKN